MHTAPDARGGDSLTRTTLQLEERLPILGIATLVKTLQRVPGVLLAEMNAEGARAIVAHDAAVPAIALLAAAERAGVRARIVVGQRARPAPGDAVSPAIDPSVRRTFSVAAALFFSLALVETMVPRLGANRFLLATLLSFGWAFIIARTVFGRRQ